MLDSNLSYFYWLPLALQVESIDLSKPILNYKFLHLGVFKVLQMHQFHLKSQNCKEFILQVSIGINNQD